MTIVFPQDQGKADLGGAIVGFLLTLWLLIKNLDNDDEKELTLKGRVWDANGLPIAGAEVFATTAKHAEQTNSSGHFSIEVKPQKQWKVTATYQGQSVEIKVEANAIDEFIELKLPKIEKKK